MSRMTDDECLKMLWSDSAWNRARKEFRAACGRIERLQSHRAYSPIDIRKLEFEAVEAIVKAYSSQ